MPFIKSPEKVANGTNLPLAHYEGDGEIPLLETTIGSHFAGIVERYPNRTAFKSASRCLTFSQLDQESDAVALALQNQGIKPGDRVATSLGISIDHILVIYACFKMGAILAPLNPSYTPQQAISAMKHIEARCYVISSFLSLPYKEPKSTKDLLDAVISARDDAGLDLECILVVNNATCTEKMSQQLELPLIDFEKMIEPYKGQRIETATSLNPQDPINLQFTSGTTSSPKAVSLSHWNILNNANICARLWGTTHEDVYVCTMPLFHCGGIVAVVLAAMSHGAMVSLPGEAFNALETLRAIRDDRCTILHGVPTMFHAWIDLLSLPEFKEHDFLHIRSGLIGAAPILPSLRGTLNQQLHLEDVGNTYGMTELCPAATMARPEDAAEKKYGTVGRPIPHQTVRIAARDDPSRTLRVGEKGEIVCAGIVMKEYWEDPERTAAAIYVEELEDGTERRWMRTGDEGMMDRDGYTTVTGRIKDIIIRGGENIYPPEIEDVLLQYPGVKTASVVGLPDERYGEVVAAFIVADDARASVASGAGVDDLDLRRTKPAGAHTNKLEACVPLPTMTATQLRDTTRAKLSRHLVPKYIIWIDEMPLTATGKVEKHKLRERGEAAFIGRKGSQLIESESKTNVVSESVEAPPTVSMKRRARSISDPAQQPSKRINAGKAMVATVT